MKENKRNIDEFFLEELGNTTEAPPSSVWDTLENRLDQNRPKQKQIGWWFYLLIGIMFIGGSIAAYYASNRDAVLSNIETEKPSFDNPAKNIQVAEGEVSTASTPDNTIGNDANNTRAKAPQQTSAATNNKTNSNNKNNNSTAVSNTNSKDDNKIGAVTSAQSFSASTVGQKGGLVNNDAATKNVTLSNNHSAKNNNQGNKTGTQTQVSQNDANRVLNPSSGSVITKAAPKATKAKNNTTVTQSAQVAAAAKTVVKSPETPARNKEDRQIAHSKDNKTSKPTAAKTKMPVVSAVAPAKTEKIKFAPVDPQKAKEETVTFGKHKAKTEAQPAIAKNTTRGLSGVPDDEQEEYNRPDTKNEDDAEPGPKVKAKEITKPKVNQVERIEQARATNPLSGEPLAAKVADESYNDPSSEPDPKAEQAAAGSGGGGGSSPTKEKSHRPLNMLIGIKAGFERGGAGYTTDKFIGMLFGEVKFNNRLSFIVQPGIKFGQTNQNYSKTTGNYFRADSTISNLYHVNADTPLGKLSYDFAYRQRYDSMIASLQAQRKLIEIEIPFLFRYKIDKAFSVLLGLNFTFGKTIGFTNNLQTLPGFTLTDTIFKNRDTLAPSPPSKFAHTGSTPFSSYKEAENVSAPSPIRFGYTFGLSYAFQQRLMIDLTIQQNLSGLSNIKDDQIRKIFAQPYVRVSVGYNLFGVKKK